jgi:transcriptional regulator with XRE-family HTH domain
VTKKTTTEIDILIGMRLRQARIARGVGQEKLGELLGITFQQVQKYEKGIHRITVARLQRIVEVLGVSLDDLLDTKAPAPNPRIRMHCN